MSAPANEEVLTPVREDRTARALAMLLGPKQASLALTHFAASRVNVIASAATFDTPNGRSAIWLGLNMLSRFVGITSLCIDGLLSADGRTYLNGALPLLRQIDTRPGREIRLDEAHAGAQGSITLVFGDQVDVNDAEDLIAVGFDAWRCIVRRGGPASCQPVTPSAIRFGGLSAACFGVAEVFKSLVASSVAPVDRPTWKRRFTRSFQFDLWKMERIGEGSIELRSAPASGPDSLPTLVLDDVFQVGAGAVGNASAFAFAMVPSTTGALALADMKRVDLKNLNRCLLFREPHLGEPKVDVVAGELAAYGLIVRPTDGAFAAASVTTQTVLLSTVDNNEVRHRMQEALPAFLVQGSTGNTTVCVSVHTAVDGRSCLVCRHPDPVTGLSRRRALSVSETAAATGLEVAVITSGRFDGKMEITDGVIAAAAARDPRIAASLERSRDEGHDLCGALGDLRTSFGLEEGPNEASVPFVSVLAGVLAAVEVMKIQLHRAGAGVPILDNVLQLDLARDYSRSPTLAFLEPPRGDCALCQDRADDVRHAYFNRNGRETPRR